MAKTISTTTLTFGLVSTEVKLKTIVQSSGTSFKTASPAIVGDDGKIVGGHNPVKQMYLDEVTGEIIGTSADCVSGIFAPDGFHEISSEARNAIDEETKLDSITLDGFIALDEAPFERATKAYFVAPGGKGGPASVKPLALLRDGLKDRGIAGYGKVTITTKTYPFLIFEKDGGLFVNLLVYANEFKQAAEASDVLAGVETDEKTLAMAGTLFDTIGGSRLALDSYVDDRSELREELVAKALAGETITVTPKADTAASNVVDLADLLAASVVSAAAAKAPAKKATAKKAADKKSVAA